MTVKQFFIDSSKIIIPSVMLILGQQLAEYVTKSEVLITYQVEKLNVNSTTVLYLRVLNEMNGTGVNDLKIFSPTNSILKASFYPSSGPTKTEVWSGTLPSNSFVEALFISDSKISTDNVDIEKIIQAKYQSPKVTQEMVKVTERGVIPMNNFLIYIVLLLFPYFIYSALNALYLKYCTSD